MMDDVADRVEQAATRIGSVLDERWEIESILGIGGMASVYAARGGDERVAIKVLHPDLARSQRAFDRFRREGEALRAAAHRAVARVHGEGMAADGCPYLVMELLRGETVEARRRRFGGRLPPAEVVQIAACVLDVLAVVHARGLLHRDVKPSNVLWLDDGSVRLIDFGIAKTVQGEEEIALTRTGALPGSLAFMSPEHALGVPGDLDARSDLWSLGATMFILLAGRPVHESQTEVEALARSASQEARSLGSVVTGLPPALIAIVDRALAFDRGKRFADAAEMRRALEMLSWRVEREPRRPSRWRFSLAAGALLALSCVGMGSFKRVRVDGAAGRVVGLPPSSSALAAVPVEPPPPAPAPPAEGQVDVAPRAERAQPSRSTHGSAAHDAGAPPPPPVGSSSAAPARPRCDPPFVIDPATGTRRVKPGC